ncbi:MAG: LysR family transcriptional regulator [Eggerthellaceae bacterium]|nr:LysR family transcriptional regulator [Eggerthellaceae bacterium]
MKIEHMKEYVRLSQTLSFTQTAREFSITQPVLSKHVSNLERELGTKLLVRSQQGLSFTKAGETFAREAEGVVAEHDAALDHLRQVQAGINTSLTIGYLAGASKKMLPPAVMDFSQEHPDVSLKFISLEIDEILDAISSDRIDLGITTSFSNEPPDLSTYRWRGLYPDHLALLVPESHRLADEMSVSITDAAGENILLTAPSFMTNDERITAVLEPIRSTARLHRGALDLESSLAFMETGKYVAIALAHFANFLDEGYSYIPIKEAVDTRIEVGALWKAEAETPALKAFVQALASAVGNRDTCQQPRAVHATGGLR